MHPSLRGGHYAVVVAALLILSVQSAPSSYCSCHAFGTSSPAHAPRATSEFDAGSGALGSSLQALDAIMAPSIDREVKNCDNPAAAEADGDDHKFRIGYLSDIEGHWDYFLESVRRSNVLDWEDVDYRSRNSQGNTNIQFQRLTLRPNAHFVYGGDTVDRGPGDIRLVRSLVSLKKRHPDRVHLLVGNRDLNKVRLPSELSESDMKRSIDEIPGPFWDRNAPSLREYLNGLQSDAPSNGSEEIRDELSDGNGSSDGKVSLEELDTGAERLRYILKHTLGCPDTFEFRREEIQILTHVHGEYPPAPETHDITPVGSEQFDESAVSQIKVSDEAVVDSFLYELSEEGSLRQYLELSQIGAIIGNTIFVHGAIDRLTMKYVPAMDTKFQVPSHPPPEFADPHREDPLDGTIVENVHDWVRSLNEYLHHGMRDFGDRPEWNAARTSRGGEGLLAIQNRPSMWGRSVVCNSYADGGVISNEHAKEERRRAILAAQEQRDPLAFEGIASDVMDPAPAQWLLEHGIERIVVGHKPTGDCPAVLSSRYTGVEVVAVDLSYSRRRDLPDEGEDGVGRRFGDSRGDAVAMVEISGKGVSRNRLETSGVLACGTAYSNEYPILGGFDDDDEGRGGEETGDPCLGRKLPDGWWVKSAVPPNYHLCRGSGRFVEYQVRSMQDVMDELLDS